MQTLVSHRAPVRRDLTSVTTAAVLWGTVGTAAQLVYDRSGASPLAVGFARLALAAAALLALHAVTARPRRLRLTRRDLPAVLLVGAALAGYQLCFFAAIPRVGVSIATLVTLGLAPVLVAAAGALGGHGSPGRGVAVALGLALLGLGLLVGIPTGTTGGADLAVGAALAAGSASGYAGMTLVSRSLAGRVDAAELTMLGFAAGAVLLLPLAAPAALSLPGDATTLGLLLYLGVVPTALAYRLFFGGLRTVQPTVATIVTLVEPLTATALAALLFRERLGVSGLLGGALLLTAVVVLYLRPQEETSPGFRWGRGSRPTSRAAESRRRRR